MFCVHCGNEIPDDSKFCIICGAPVEELEAEGYSADREGTVLLGPDEMQDSVGGYDNAYAEGFGAGGYVDGYDDGWMEEENGSGRKKGLMIFFISLLAALLIAAGIIFVLKPFSDDSDDSSGILGIGGDGSGEVSPGDVMIVDSDWDWDSSGKSGGNYSVDVIMSVRNDSDTPITGIEFEIESRDGEPITNEEKEDEPFEAQGYIREEDSGVMVASVVVGEKDIEPEDVTIEITEVMTNSDIPGDYEVPIGYFTHNGGPNNDYYDIVVSNYNDTKVNKNSIVVAVRYDGDESGTFSGDYPADATGRLSSDIDAQDEEYTQEKAFVDPNLDNNNYDAYTIYVLDRDYYNNPDEE